MVQRNFLLALVVVVISLPIIKRIWNGSTSATLRLLKSTMDSRKVLVIFEGMMAPPVGEFRRFADDYDGDVIYVEYPHDGCGLDKYFLQIRELIVERRYSRVDVIGVSIGAEIFPTLVDQLGSCIDLRLYGICPAGPDFLAKNVRWKARIASLVLSVLKVVLGVFGEIPLVKWNGSRRSLSEFVEQGVIAVWDRPFWREFYLDGGIVWMPLTGYEQLLMRSYGCRFKVALKGFVLAEDDALIDNASVRELFPGVAVRYVPGEHAVLSDRYVDALRELGLYES